MYYLISALIVIASILLILIVLVQNSKGGGLASNFAGSTQSMGVRKTADFLEKSTWTLAIVILALTLLSSLTIDRTTSEENGKASMIEEQINSAVDPTAAPIIPNVDPNATAAQPEESAE